MRITRLGERSLRAIKETMRSADKELTKLADSRVYRKPQSIYEDQLFHMTRLQDRLESVMAARSQNAAHLLQTQSAKLHALSPLAILSRGYAAVTPDEFAEEKSTHAYRHASELKVGDQVRVIFDDGHAKAEIRAVVPKKEITKKHKKEQS